MAAIWRAEGKSQVIPISAVGAFVCTPEATDIADKPEGWTSDKWATPWPILSYLEDRYGKFDLDPCCEPHTAKAPTFYTIEDDGLSKPWFGNVFVNPPYSNPRAWCERALEASSSGEANQVVMLLPCATDTSWFHDVVWPHAELHYLRGRVRFLGWRGTPIKAPRAPSLVAVYRSGFDDQGVRGDKSVAPVVTRRIGPRSGQDRGSADERG